MRSIDPRLLAKTNLQNQTIYNNADPRMSIQITRAKTTVTDNTYWYVETIREKGGLGDLSLAARRTRPYGSPDRIYNIYVENGLVKTATREYPDYTEIKWIDRFSLGTGKAVAIAFDGEWQWHKLRRQLVTYEKPFVFWTDNSNKLWSQLWDEVNTKLELATDVIKVKAIRGWKNINFHSRDHGIIAGYIKSDGKVYYRAYCIQEDGNSAWEIERQVTEFTRTAVNINLFITNDYRTGFVIEDSQGKVHWIISDRNWAGMAINSEYITANAVTATVTLHAPTVNAFLEAYNQPITIGGTENWSKEIEIITRHKLYSANHLDFEVIDELNRYYYPDKITHIRNNKYKLEFIGENDFNNIGLDKSAIIKFKGIYTLNEDGVLYQPFQTTFYPENLAPPPPAKVIAEEYMTAAPAAITVSLIELEYYNIYGADEDLITASAAEITVLLEYVDIENP